MIEFIEKEPIYDVSPFTGKCLLYPTYMVKGGKELFVFNRREPDESWHRREDEIRKEHLLRTDGKYFRFHGFYDDPFEMLREIAERKHTLDGLTEDDNKWCSFEKDGYIDFHGNRKEVSAAFLYRIYDREIAEQIMEAVRYIHRKEYDKVLAMPCCKMSEDNV